MVVYLIIGEKSGARKTFLFTPEELQDKIMEGTLKGWDLKVSPLNPFIYRTDINF